VNIGPGIPERRKDIYGHVRMGVFSGIGAPLMCLMKNLEALWNPVPLDCLITGEQGATCVHGYPDDLT